MTNKERKAAIKLIGDAYAELDRLCDKHSSSAGRMLYESRQTAEAQERQHRRGGFSQGKYHASVGVCAVLFAVRGALEPKAKRSFTHRLDFVQAYGAAEELESRGARAELAKLRRKYQHAIADIDYCQLAHN